MFLQSCKSLNRNLAHFFINLSIHSFHLIFDLIILIIVTFREIKSWDKEKLLATAAGDIEKCLKESGIVGTITILFF